jgi:3-deoxy-7-phosphoheptulonate synthase
MSKIAADIESRRAGDLPLVGRSESGTRRIVKVGDVAVGGEEFIVMAGPCAVESREQIEQAARHVDEHGGRILRGGAFKPRTSPYSFQGLGAEGVELLRRASLKAGLPFVTEVMSVDDIDLLAPRVDAFQVGTRNMHNFALLDALGQQSTPILLKRGFGATLREWLLAAEYVARGGNENIILCERGIRSFGNETRFVLDLAGAIWAQQHSSLPVIIDPSHATGDPALIGPLCRAAVAAGIDGVIVEVHPDPGSALSDGDQALTFDSFEAIMASLPPIAAAVGRTMTTES